MVIAPEDEPDELCARAGRTQSVPAAATASAEAITTFFIPKLLGRTGCIVTDWLISADHCKFCRLPCLEMHETKQSTAMMLDYRNDNMQKTSWHRLGSA